MSSGSSTPSGKSLDVNPDLISLDDFVVQALADVHAFREDWEVRHLQYPPIWPLENTNREWNEQLLMYMDETA